MSASHKFALLLIRTLTFALLSSSPALAGPATALAKHAPIQVVRDSSGYAMLAREGQYTSTNWSGYVLPEFITRQQYISAQGSWLVPAVVFKKTPAVSVNWVGIGG